MPKLANDAITPTAPPLRARRDHIQPAGGHGYWGDWAFTTADSFEEVMRSGYFGNCGQLLTRFDRIAITCTSDALTRGDKLGPAVHALLVVTRCEQQPGREWDIRVAPLGVLRETADLAPALDPDGKPLPAAQPIAA